MNRSASIWLASAPGDRIGPELPVQFSPEARDELGEIEAHIVAAGTPQTATPSVDAIVEFCMALAIFPDRGVSCDDLLPGYE